MTLGNRLSQLRQQSALTLKDLSTLTGLSISHLSDIEHGRAEPSLSALGTIAKAFNMSASLLLNGVEL